VVVGTTQVPAPARGWIHKAGNHGFIELVADRVRGVLIGATAAGPNGGEMLLLDRGSRRRRNEGLQAVAK
jgi:pyruvate/2-oxoglutarate dehydrogenase complex dihydrolipoamide dehydrogenase (E3) component